MLRTLKKLPDESWKDYGSRLRYETLRRIHPRYREQYRIERLIGPRNCLDQIEAYQFRLLTELGLKPHQRLLDVGCGPLAAGIRLIPYLDPGNYVGLDSRTAPLSEGYRRIAQRSLADRNPRLVLSSDFGGTELKDREFDWFWMSQLSYHLGDETMEALFTRVDAAMTDGGVFVFDVLDAAIALPDNAHWDGFVFHQRPLDYYLSLARRHGMSATLRGRLEDYGYPERIRILKRNLVVEVRRTGQDSAIRNAD